MSDKLSFALAKQLCTPKELMLLAASRKDPLAAASAAQLKKRADLARRQRDKWRDQYRGQRRDRQEAKGARGIEANRRSRQKAELFDLALARYTAELAKRGDEKTPSRASKKLSKSQRSGEHRQTRGWVKGRLAEKRLLLSPATKPARAAVAAKAVSAKPAAPAKPKKTGNKKRKKIAPPWVLGLADAAQQRKLAAAAKRKRFKISGRTTRVQAHVAARGKRQQARRDAKR